ncbi:MAG: SDR family oxidoreductase [Bacteroidetes bacterium]|nr:SDR family oxidoreductase [Bacteroidota bacterium]
MYKVLISGATRGIGRAIAIEFAKRGCSIAFCARNEEAVNAFELLLRRDFHIEAFGFAVDLSSKTEVQQFGVLALQRLGGLDILVNNAGVFLPGTIGMEEDGVFEQLMAVNLAAPYHLSRVLLPELKKSKRAHVFNVCSTASIMAYTNGGSYCISKFGLLGMSKVLRAETLGTSIRVTAVIPGATLTDSWSGSDLPAERFMKAEAVATAVASCWDVNESAVVEELLIRPLQGDI